MTKSLYDALDPLIQAEMTAEGTWPAEPECTTLAQRAGAAFTYGWVVGQLNAGKSVAQMATLASEVVACTEAEMRGVLQQYGFVGTDEEGTTGPWPWDYRRCGFRRRG